MPRALSRFFASTAILAAVISCQGDATGPHASTLQPAASPATNTVSATATLAVPETVLVIQRFTPLPADLTVSAVIGPEGGTLHIRDAGATLTIPKGAVAAPTNFSMTAKAGPYVAYEFEPHGTTFPVALTFRQNLNNTWAGRFRQLAANLQGSYYSTDLASAFIDPWHFFAVIQEARPATVDRGHKGVTFTIQHFSGYLLSSGRSSTWGSSE